MDAGRLKAVIWLKEMIRGVDSLFPGNISGFEHLASHGRSRRFPEHWYIEVNFKCMCHIRAIYGMVALDAGTCLSHGTSARVS